MMKTREEGNRELASELCCCFVLFARDSLDPSWSTPSDNSRLGLELRLDAAAATTNDRTSRK